MPACAPASRTGLHLGVDTGLALGAYRSAISQFQSLSGGQGNFRMASLGARPARPTCVAAVRGAGCHRALRDSFLSGGQSWVLRRSVAARSQLQRRRSPPPTVAGEPVWRGDKDVLKEDRLKLFRTVSGDQNGSLLSSTRCLLVACCDGNSLAGCPAAHPPTLASINFPPFRPCTAARCTTSRPGPRTAAPSATCGTSWVGTAVTRAGSQAGVHEGWTASTCLPFTGCSAPYLPCPLAPLTTLPTPAVPAGLFRSRIVSGLRVPLLLIALESTLVCAYEAARNAQLLPAMFRSIQIRAPMLFS